MKNRGEQKERGAGLIVLIIVMAFLLTVGAVLISVTGTGPRVAGNVRLQEQAFNAAEAGFDSAWNALEESFLAAGWTSFDGHYVTSPSGIDLPIDKDYFRRLNDEDLLDALDNNGDGIADDLNVIFFKNPYVLNQSGGLDARYTYTAFLIDDEAGGGDPDAGDALLICIGTVQQGNMLTTSRLEIELSIQLAGTSP